jgi:uncharacterized Ntn-hydrolase superfamily protein
VTFSIVARSVDAQMFGVAIASSSPAVAARCTHALAGIGAAATQNVTDPSLGPRMLARLAASGSAHTALEQCLATTSFGAYRQLLLVGRDGAPVIHSGAQALGSVGCCIGVDAAAAGNLLADPEVPAVMMAAFDAASGHLGARLLQALRAGVARGGEAGPIHSAGLLVVREVAWPIVDLRVDWSDADPVAELSSIWDIYAPQIDDYVRRALDPAQSPGFGVPGDPADSRRRPP